MVGRLQLYPLSFPLVEHHFALELSRRLSAPHLADARGDPGDALADGRQNCRRTLQPIEANLHVAHAATTTTNRRELSSLGAKA